MKETLCYSKSQSDASSTWMATECTPKLTYFQKLVSYIPVAVCVQRRSIVESESAVLAFAVGENPQFQHGSRIEQGFLSPSGLHSPNWTPNRLSHHTVSIAHYAPIECIGRHDLEELSNLSKAMKRSQETRPRLVVVYSFVWWAGDRIKKCKIQEISQMYAGIASLLLRMAVWCMKFQTWAKLRLHAPKAPRNSTPRRHQFLIKTP